MLETWIVTVEDDDGRWWEPVTICTPGEIPAVVEQDYRRRLLGYESGTYEGLVPARYWAWREGRDGYERVEFRTPGVDA